jgi:hypothetical protein
MKLKLILILLLLSLSLLSWSQYPTQRIEGKDTVVVMTKIQASEINETFRKNKDSINYYKQEAINYITFSYMLSNKLENQINLNDSLVKINQEQNIYYNDNLKKLKKENKYSFIQDVIISSTWITAVIFLIRTF